MDLTFRGFALGLMAAVTCLIGCGSSSGAAKTYPEPQPIDANGADVQRDAGADVQKPPPMPGQASVQVFKGAAALLHKGPSCTNEPGATGDRWCAFLSPSTTSLDGVDLYVLNVSRANAGAAITCAGGLDPNCLKLTGGFAEDGTTPAPHAAGFQGDTLVYFDRSLTGYGWRPGMTNGRALATGSVHDCFPAARGNGVLCLRDLAVQPTAGIIQSDLLVGHLDAAGDAPPLTRVDTVISSDSSTTSGLQRFRIGFSPDGAWVAWSSRADPTGVEVLKAQMVGNDTTRVTVASDVSRWTVSPDGTRWYWLSRFNYDSAMRSGTLQTAPFPAGAGPTTLLPAVAEFSVTRAGAIVARTMVTAGRGDLKGIPDPIAAPTTVTMLDTGVLAFLAVGARGDVAYTKNFDGVLQLLDLYLKNVDGVGAGCALTTDTSAPQVISFMPGGGAMVWARATNLDTTDPTLKFRASLTRVNDCMTNIVSPDVATLGVAGDDGVLFEDGFDGTDGTLRIQPVTNGTTVGASPAVLIQTRVNDFVPLAPAPGVVLYTVNSGSTQDGVYLHPVPASPGGGGDAGVVPADASADTGLAP